MSGAGHRAGIGRAAMYRSGMPHPGCVAGCTVMGIGGNQLQKSLELGGNFRLGGNDGI